MFRTEKLNSGYFYTHTLKLGKYPVHLKAVLKLFRWPPSRCFVHDEVWNNFFALLTRSLSSGMLPSWLQIVLHILHLIHNCSFIIIWGGAGGRDGAPESFTVCCQTLNCFESFLHIQFNVAVLAVMFAWSDKCMCMLNYTLFIFVRFWYTVFFLLGFLNDLWYEFGGLLMRARVGRGATFYISSVLNIVDGSSHETELEHPLSEFCDWLVCCLISVQWPDFEFCSCFYLNILYEAKSLN